MWFEGSPPSGSGKSFNPNGRPIEEIPCILPTLGPNHASRDAERAVFAFSKKIQMTMCNAEKTRAVRAAILLAVCWRCENPISKFDNQGSEMSIRLLQIGV